MIPKIVEQSSGYCGPASLVSLLDYYGISKTEDEMARLCGTVREEGTYHQDLVKALEGLGLRVVAKEEGTWEELRRLTAEGKPVLVGWFSDFSPPVGDHFSLVYAVSDTALSLMDPEYGEYRVIPKEEFLKRWYDYDTKGNIRVRSWMLYVVK